MAIKGSLKEASLPDVCSAGAGAEDRLPLDRDRSNFGLHLLRQGRIAYASIVNRRDRLGDILVKHEKISRSSSTPRFTASPGARQEAGRDPRHPELLTQQSSSATSVCRRGIVYYCSPGRRGRSTSKPTCGGAAGLPGLDQPGVAVARGRAAGGRVGSHREEDPSFDLIFLVTAIASRQRREADGRMQDGSCRCSMDRATVNQVIEDSGLGEFEVGKALYGS